MLVLHVTVIDTALSEMRNAWLIIGLLLGCTKGNDVIGQLVRDYFERLFVRQIVAFGCWSPEERAIFSRSLMRWNFSLSCILIHDGLDMARILKVNYYKLGVLLDLDCPQSDKIFDQFHRQGLRHNESYFWLMPTIQSRVPEYFEKLPLNIATEMTVTMRGSDGDYLLYDVYNPSYRHGGNLNVTYIGSWNVINGLDIVITQYKYKRRGDLQGLALNASIVIDHPAVPDYETYISNPINPHYDTMHRYNYALTRQLRDYYNFTMNLSRGLTWGYLINGSFNGIIGDMTKGIVDFGATPFQFKPERLDVIEYTVQGWVARPCFIFRHPKKNELSNPFLKPFEKRAWYWIVAFGLLNWSILYLTTKIENKYDSQIANNTLDTHPALETALITAAAMCQQGLSDGPRCCSGRIAFLSLFLWGLLLFQYYSASVVGSLLSKQPNWITTLQDLADSSLEIGIEDMAYAHDFFTTTTDPIALQLHREKMAVNDRRKREPYFSAVDGLKRVQKGGFAFHVATATAYKIIEETFNEKEICDLAEIQLTSPKPTATGTAKHSPFKKMITYGLRQVVEHGMGRRLLEIWRHRKPQCPEGHNADPVPVLINEFSSALFLLCLGIIVAILVMILEYFLQRRQNFSKIYTEQESNVDKTSINDNLNISLDGVITEKY